LTAVLASTADVLRAEILEIRPAEYLARVGDQPIPLTVRELSLLCELARRQGRIVSREELYLAVWGRPFRKDDRSVDVYVRKLRHKLELAVPEWRFIHTHFGFGYRFEPQLSHPFHNTATGR
jgi:DNA-binding response OmpR family regulator